jgi:cyclopropane fatty-acyl-phospholipid synthase-like methyltransferase
MIEAVGHQYLDTYLGKCSSLLRPAGAMLLQAITIRDQLYSEARRSVDFIKRFIFPGSFIPSVQAIVESLARATDMKLFHLEGHRSALRTHVEIVAGAFHGPAERGTLAGLSGKLRAHVGVLSVLLRGRIRGAAIGRCAKCC